ncbi:MAG: ABC transporter ATP-binding protein [Gammaproteobacteria bacterium]
MISLEHIVKTYQRGDGTPVAALRDITCEIAAGEFVTVRGASGSGKSSLLNLIGCLDTPTAGTYRLAGEDVSRYTDRERSAVRSRRIGFVFQAFNLLARTTAVENVEVPALYTDGNVDRRRALGLLERVGLAHRSDHFVAEMSGGEQQRVAIARALMNNPPLLLADEPTGNVDSAVGDSIMELLAGLNRDGLTIVLVTHDERVAAWAGRELRIRDGLLASDRAQSPRPNLTGTREEPGRAVG